MVSRKKSRKASRKRRSSKPKKIGYYVKNGKVLVAYEGHNRQGKMVHKDSAGKTIRKTVKIHRLKRDANKHAKAKKGRKASRKASRKRKSAKFSMKKDCGFSMKHSGMKHNDMSYGEKTKFSMEHGGMKHDMHYGKHGMPHHSKFSMEKKS